MKNAGSHDKYRPVDLVQADPELFDSRMVIGDEAWVHYHNPEFKFESMEWKYAGSSRRKMLKITRTTTKSMTTVF